MTNKSTEKVSKLVIEVNPREMPTGISKVKDSLLYSLYDYEGNIDFSSVFYFVCDLGLLNFDKIITNPLHQYTVDYLSKKEGITLYPFSKDVFIERKLSFSDGCFRSLKCDQIVLTLNVIESLYCNALSNKTACYGGLLNRIVELVDLTLEVEYQKMNTMFDLNEDNHEALVYLLKQMKRMRSYKGFLEEGSESGMCSVDVSSNTTLKVIDEHINLLLQ